MHLKYIHYFGNESSDSLLEAYGLVTRDQNQINTLQYKQCPNCAEPNKRESKFCMKCKMVLTYDAYNETLAVEQSKVRKIEDLTKRQEQFEILIQSLIDSGQLKPIGKT